MKSFSISRRWYFCCLTCLVVVCTGALLAQEATAKTALFVVGSTTLSTSDAALKKRLDYYYTTTVRDDSASADTSKDVIVISASVDPAQVNTKYKAATKGVVVLHQALFDDMGMTAANAFGTLASQTQIKINNSAHQMAAGFQSASVVTVLNAGRTVAWGTPSSNASLVALSADGNSTHGTIFAYDTQRVMVNYTAPARRVGYYVADASALTTNGWKLFDYAIDWADGDVPPVSGGSLTAITWSATNTIKQLASGCDSFSPTWAADGNMYTAYGDCKGVSGTLAKRSMGLARIVGPATDAALQDIDTGAAGAPDIDQTGSGSGLDALGDGRNGKKPSSLLSVSGRVFIWVRNMTTAGTESQLKYTDNYAKQNATWSWATWRFTEFGYPVFVQDGKDYVGGGTYVYVVAHDNRSAYEAADRFILMRVPSSSILDQSAYQFFSGTASTEAWVSYSNRAQRTAIFTSKGRCLRNGMTYNAARKRYYWWQQIPPTKFDPDTRLFGGFGIYSAANPWGPWTPVYYTEKWGVGPGDRGEFPTKWMGSQGINASGDMYLIFSGNDSFAIRKGTIAANH